MSRVTVWHDGACPLCQREMALMRRLDRRRQITFIDVNAGTCPLDRAAMLARLHAREEGGTIVIGAAAFAAMWRAIPLLRPLGLIAGRPPALALLEWLYTCFLRVRPRLQRWARRVAA
jgi:predicted DCC family thiol-disulfide oxidoreductase YuxK